jgi:F0F1-type ATP synthase assembly protein I
MIRDYFVPAFIVLVCLAVMIACERRTIASEGRKVDSERMRFNDKNIFKFTATGIVVGLALGCLLDLMSGGIFIPLFIGTLGLLVGGVLGIVHRNDP